MVKFMEAAFRKDHMILVELNIFLPLVILMFINFFVEAEWI